MNDGEWGGKTIPLGSLVFDPYLIVYQIGVMQALFYLTLGVVLVLMQGLVFMGTPTLDMVFDPDAQHPASSSGMLVAVAHFATSLMGAYYLLHVVGRSKKCLDFTATVFLIHAVLCTFYARFPTSGAWWSLLLANLSAMSLISEYLCMKRELREISIQNPDERHGQQATLVKQKEKQLKLERVAAAAAASASPRGDDIL